MDRMRRNLILLGSSLLLLLLWQAGAFILDSQILLPKVGPVLSTLLSLAKDPPFTRNLMATVFRALQSFLIIMVAATSLGVLAGRVGWFSLFLKPFVTVLKAIPVMSIILLAFIWFTSGTVPLFSAFLMGFPVMYVQIEQGVLQLDKNLEQMCDLYEFTPRMKIFHFVIPSLIPSFVTGAKTALSMVWKVVIAAEVLTAPKYGVGSRMHLAQVQLDTDKVLSWTLMAIFLTAVGDLLFDGIVFGCGKLKIRWDSRRATCNL